MVYIAHLSIWCGQAGKQAVNIPFLLRLQGSICFVVSVANVMSIVSLNAIAIGTTIVRMPV
jgi:hypothetical protein